jgi:hypothetical protein
MAGQVLHDRILRSIMLEYVANLSDRHVRHIFYPWGELHRCHLLQDIQLLPIGIPPSEYI